MTMSLTKLKAMMAAAGAGRMYFKNLAANDNSKNQVYLGGDFSALNVLPYKEIYTDDSEEGSKRERYKASLDFSWLGEGGELYDAPNAQLILYPKYPEVRLSGFLKGCAYKVPLMASRDAGRVLLFGIRDDARIIAYVADADSAVARELGKTPHGEKIGVFYELSIATKTTDESRQILLNKLHEIYLKGWIDSWRLGRGGERLPCNATNCGGHTLEAEFGISANGFSEPDFMGWEVKQYGVKSLTKPDAKNAITLMTPEPTGGFYKSRGIEPFIRKFGYPDKKGREDRLNFGGIYACGKTTNNLNLILDGYDAMAGTIENFEGGLVLQAPDGEPAAVWHFRDMMAHWNKKHAKAAYVPSLCQKIPQRQYHYGNIITLGIKTDFLRFLRLMNQGLVYYDPGIKLEEASSAKGKPKKRSQFRVKYKDLKGLYDTTEQITLSAEKLSPMSSV